jgi:hypothetical protein
MSRLNQAPKPSSHPSLLHKFFGSLRKSSQPPQSRSRAPRAAVVEGGIKSRTLQTSPSELAAELDEISIMIDSIRERLAKGSGRLVSSAERAKAEALMAKMVTNGALVYSAAFVERLKVTRQALSKALKSHRVFYLEVGGQRFYPDFYLDTRLERRQVELVSQSLGELPGASKLQFFVTKKASLEGQTPLEALARGQFSRVRTAAQGFAER